MAPFVGFVLGIPAFGVGGIALTPKRGGKKGKKRKKKKGVREEQKRGKREREGSSQKKAKGARERTSVRPTTTKFQRNLLCLWGRLCLCFSPFLLDGYFQQPRATNTICGLRAPYSRTPPQAEETLKRRWVLQCPQPP